MLLVIRSSDPPDDREAIGPRELEAMGEVEREREARELEWRDPSASLWVTVLRTALDDFAYVRDKSGRKGLQRHELKRLQQIREHDPVAFFRSGWFEEICDYLGLDPDSVRPSAAELRRVGRLAA